MKEYTVVCAGTTVSLIEEVNKLIKEGWRPQGGVCVGIFPKHGGETIYDPLWADLYYQA